MSAQLDQYFQHKLSLTSGQRENLAPSNGMHLELLRLTSFLNWPRWVPMMPNRLARAGFFYTGERDEVECFSCHGRVKQWLTGDRPLDRHRRVNSDCPLVCNEDTENHPLPRGRPDDEIDRPAAAAAPSPPLGDAQLGRLATDSVHSMPLGLPSNPLTPNYQSAPASVGSNVTPTSQLLPDYQNEQARLDTFTNWPSSAFVGPEEMARAGFVYLGTGDRVQCAFCKGVLRNWAPGDQAFNEHQKHFPNCAFVRNPSAANSLGGRSNMLPRDRNSQSQNQFAALGIEVDLPKNHTYALEEVRLGTFTNWPTHLTQKPDVLAQAGFFYANVGDSVKCFWCDGGLKNWDPMDDPWVEHARWFPRCGHIKRTKGADFIERIKKSTNSTPSQAPASGSGLPEIDQREVTARMDTTVVRGVLSMGFDRMFVRQVLDYRLRTRRDDFQTAEELLETVLEYMERPPANFPPPTPAHLMGNSGPGAAEASAPVSGSSPTGGAASGSATAESGTGSAPAEATTTTTTKRNKKKKKKAKNQGNSGTNQNSQSEEKMEIEEEPNTAAAVATRAGEGRVPECKVCMDGEVNVVFLPCGHLVCCQRCAPALKNCPICRALIRGTVNVFVP